MDRSRLFILPAMLVLPICVTLASPTSLRADSRQTGTRPMRLAAKIPVDPAVTVGTLDNGLRYYIRVNRNPEKRASLMLAVNVGSVLEDDDQIGLAHFVEHMGFNGTKHFPDQELVKYFETVGVRFGSALNASTSFDQTVYTLTVPTDSQGVVERSFDALEDWSRGVDMTDAEIEKERGVIVEEWRLGRGAEERIFNKSVPMLYKDSRYAVRLPIGTKEGLLAFKPDALRRFYHDWYRPDLMAVIAVGDFDPATIRRLIEEHFASMPAVEQPRPRTIYPVPDHKEMLFSIQSDPEKTNTNLALFIKKDPLPQRTLADYRRSLLFRMHQDMFRQRLVELSKKPDSPLLGVMERDQQLVRSKDVFLLAAEVKENAIAPGLDMLLTEVSRAKRYGFTEPELERAKEQWLSVRQWADQREKVPSAQYSQRCLANFLRGDPILSPEQERKLTEELMPGIKLKEVNELLTQWFNGTNCVVLVAAPEKQGVTLPTQAELTAVFDSIEHKEIGPYTEAEPERPLLDKTPRPGRIAAEKKLPDLGVTVWTLSNGARVILKPTDFDREKIFFEAYSNGGTSVVSDKDYLSAALAGQILSECGVGNFTDEELRKKLSGKIASASAAMGELTEAMNGKALTKDERTMFELLYLRFTAPRTCPEEFQAFLNKVREYLRNRSASPEQVFSDTVQATIGSYHFRRLPPTEARIDEINLDSAYRVFKDRFADASGFTFIFTGDIDLKAIKPLVETYIGSLPSLHRKDTWRDLGIEPPGGVVKKVVRKGIEPKAQVQLYFSGPFQWSQENNSALRAATQVLQTKLHEELREELSGTYGVGVNGSGEKYPRQEYTISIAFGCAPERVDELVKMVFAEIDSLKNFGPAESYVIRFKETSTRSLEESMKQNSFWSSRLRYAYFLGEDPSTILKQRDLIESVTPAIIQDAAKKYFDMNHYAEFVLLPEKEAPKANAGPK